MCKFNFFYHSLPDEFLFLNDFFFEFIILINWIFYQHFQFEREVHLDPIHIVSSPQQYRTNSHSIRIYENEIKKRFFLNASKGKSSWLLTVFLLFAMYHPKHKGRVVAPKWPLSQDIVALLHSYVLPNLFQMVYSR